MFRRPRLRASLQRAYHLPIIKRESWARKEGPIDIRHTSGTFSLSVCDEAASVVTVRFETTRFDKDTDALLLKGRALAGLKDRLNIVLLEIPSVQLKSGELTEAVRC